MKNEDKEHFYEHIYGISRLSPGYWWRRRSKYRTQFALLFLLVVATPIALAIWGPSLKTRLAQPYHAFRAKRYSADAQASLKSGDDASARLHLQNALRHDPSNADTLLLYARTLRKLDKDGYALWAFQAQMLKPDDPNIATLAIGYALEENQTEVAEFLLRDSLRRFPKNAGLHILACHHLMRRGNFVAALRSAREAKDLAPDNPEARFLVASLSSRSNDPKTREAALAELRVFREKPEFRVRASWALVNALAPSAPDAAIAILDELSQDDKTAWQARLRRIAITHRIDPSKTPDSFSALWANANTPQKRRDVIEAAETLAPALAQTFLASLDDSESRSLPVLLSQFRLWAHAKEWRRLADRANAVSKTAGDTDRVILALWLAKANRELDQGDAERTCLRAAMTRCEGDTALALRSALQLNRLGMRDAAIQFYEQVAAHAPGQIGAFARSQITAANRAAGRTTEMLQTWEKALSRNAGDPQAMNNVASCLLLLGRDTTRALQLASNAHAKRPKSAFFADTYALALATAGRVPEALAICQKLPKARLNQPDFALNYASVLDRAGRKSEAIALVSNINQRALLPEQNTTLQRILGIGTAPTESLLLDPTRRADEPSIPNMPPKPLGPTPGVPELSAPPPMEFMPLPHLDNLGEKK